MAHAKLAPVCFPVMTDLSAIRNFDVLIDHGSADSRSPADSDSRHQNRTLDLG
ncbi:MAG TPA: hypothetical protein VER98_09045 [Terriglobia bacterium]|nr:hypothetical protein [Terriglobia bacterium]